MNYWVIFFLCKSLFLQEEASWKGIKRVDTIETLDITEYC